MATGGHVKVYRSFFSHWLWEEERCFNRSEAFLDLLQLAAFAPTKRVVSGKLISLDVGELVASERFLETRWKWSRTKVRRFLALLKEDQMLDRRKDHGETIITLCNYKEFHEGAAEKRTSKQTKEKPEKNRRETTDQTTGEPNNKKIKKIEEDQETKKGGSDELFPDDLPFDSDGFQASWAEWEAHRREIRKKLTPSTKAKQLKQLSKLNEREAIETINQSIEKGWTGLFPEKCRGNSKLRGNRPTGETNRGRTYGKRPSQGSPGPTIGDERSPF